MLLERPKYELADILQLKQDNLSAICANRWKLRTLHALRRCRTAAMGGHIDRCNHHACQHIHLSYNSCRNRHCPKCQGHKREQWIAAREKDLLNCRYFHVVFTIPDCINPLALQYPREVYAALFKSSWRVLKGFAANPKHMGAQTGMIAVLHTWGQNLSLHPHLHCIVPAGGLNKQGKWKHSKSKGKYLFDVKQMSKVFRAQFTQELSKHVQIPAAIRKQMFAKKWVVYAKQPFAGPKQVINYLGSYTHKVAISNHRIKNLEKGQVIFSAKDYRLGAKKVMLRLSASEFIRRFSLHVLPRGFTRMRHYGILSGSNKKRCKVTVDAQLGAIVSLERQPKALYRLCPKCRKGSLETILCFDQRGPPKDWLKKLQTNDYQTIKK